MKVVRIEGGQPAGALAAGGALPLCFTFGTGSELRQPLGITIVGGLMVSQVLTLFTTPVIYLAFDRLGGGTTKRRPEDDEAHAEAHA